MTGENALLVLVFGATQYRAAQIETITSWMILTSTSLDWSCASICFLMRGDNCGFWRRHRRRGDGPSDAAGDCNC
jgi:hypothetical protein